MHAFSHLLGYKQWADRVTLEAIEKMDAAAFPRQHHLMLRLMNHIYVVDRIFWANLHGQPHGYTALNTPETPDAEMLKGALANSTADFLSLIESLTADQWHIPRDFTFVDGGPGCMTASEMLEHLLLHGTYHRGAVGWLLSECGQTPPKDVLTVYLRSEQEKEKR